MMLTRFFSNGIALMVLAAVLYCVSDVTLKLLSGSLPTGYIIFIRFGVGGILLLPLLVSMGTPLRGMQIRYLILRGVFGTVSFFCLLKSMSLIPLSLTMVLFYTFPIFAALYSFLWLGEKMGKREILLITVGLIGIVLLINPSFHSFSPGYVYALLSSVIGAMAMVTIRKAREANGPLIIYFYFCLIGGVLSFPLFLAQIRVPDPSQSILLGILGISVLVAQVMMNQGFKYCRAAEGSMLLMSELVFTGIAGVLLFKDPVTLHFGAGALLVIGSGVGLNWINRKTASDSYVSSTRKG